MLRLPPFVTLSATLYHFPSFAVNDCLMDALKYHVVFFRVFKPLLILERLGVGFEVDYIPHVLAGIENFIDGGFAPVIRAVLVCAVFLSAPADALAFPVFCGGKDFFLLQPGGNAVFAHTVNAQLVNIPHNLGGVLVYNPLFGIVGVFDVAVERLRERNTGGTAKPLRAAYLAGNVPCVPLVHNVSEGRKLIFSLGAVHAVIDGDKADIVLWEKIVGVVAHLPDILRAAVSTTMNVVLMLSLLQPRYGKVVTRLAMLGILTLDFGTALYCYFLGDLTMLSRIDIILFAVLCFAVRPLFKDTFMQWLLV